ncbi:MAG: TonB-dependent receptor [Tannerella sp.]|jgi:TonB-linked SusC/RagA family outer membrane protein|nr:TonB-dependent receptor [Tannerella sp.]
MKAHYLLLAMVLTGAFFILPEKASAFETNDIIPINAENQQQKKKITGVVTDETGEAAVGANVSVKGTTIGTITDIDGKFSLEVPQEGILQISYIGYVAQEFSIGSNTTFNITLSEDTQLLDEVVVVGFGVQKKVNLTGSVGVATAKDLEARPVANVTQALQGIIPGLNISNSGNGGELNATKSIDIRGTGTVGKDASGKAYTSGSPLILIDGMEGSLNTINPQDIESISVLKDAAASSIYGSRAPFGVILVTTKSGTEGRPVINYNNSFRFNTPVMMPKMQNSWEFVNFFDDANFNGSNSHLYDDAYKTLVKDYFDGKKDPTDVAYLGSGGKWNYDYTYANVNWLKEYYKDWSPSQEHNVSVSGGSKSLTYYISSNYMTQNGFMRYGTEDYDRYTLTAKISAKLTDYLKADYSNRWVRTDYARPTQMNDDFYNHILRRARPVRAIKDPNGYYMSDINYIQTMEEGGRHKEQNDVLSQQIKLTLTPIKNWNIIAEMNIRTNNDWTHWDQIRIYSHYADNPEATYLPTTSASNDQVYEYAYRSTFQNPNVYTNYDFSIGDHNLTAMAGFQAEQLKNRKLNAQRTGMINTDQPILDLTTDNDNMSINGDYQEWSTAGFFGRINYDYQGKYLIEGNLRYDGSSRYRKDNRWVWTPSVSIGWNIARETFFESAANYIQFLKLRASYGTLANQNTTSWYPTYVTMSTGTSDGYWLVNGAKPNTAAAPGLVSSTLTWEKIYNTNFGLDFGALKNRLTGSFDYFIRETKDMVGVGVELPVILGTAVPVTNNTDLRTFGWEFEIGWRDQIGDFSYGVRFNISDSQTKILRFANPTNSLSSYREGEVIGNIYGYTTVGIAKSDEEMNAHLATLPNGGQNAIGSNWAAGDIMYADLNGDGKINNGANTKDDMGDLKKIGNNTARYRTGINLDFAWKGIDLQMFWQGVLKRDFDPGENSMVFWGTTGSGQWWSTAFKDHLDYFRAEADHPLGQNLNSYYPRPLFNNKNHKTQTAYLQNAAYMRLKNLQIGYTFPKSVTHKLLLQNLRVFVSGENLLTITGLSDTMDPETAGIGVQGGTVYPLSRTYSFGLSVNF